MFPFFGFILCVNTIVIAKDFVCTKYKSLPVAINTCQGEGACGYLDYDKAIQPVSIYEQPSKNSKIVDRLGRCELIQDTEPYLVVKKFGVLKAVTVREDLSKFGVKEGDTIPLVSHVDYDEVRTCIGDETLSVLTEKTNSISFVKILEENETQSWVQLKTPRNVIGYALDVPEEWEKEPWYLDTYTYDDNKRCPEDLGKP